MVGMVDYLQRLVEGIRFEGISDVSLYRNILLIALHLYPQEQNNNPRSVNSSSKVNTLVLMPHIASARSKQLGRFGCNCSIISIISMKTEKVLLEFYPIDNLPRHGRLTLKARLDKLKTVKDLKEKVASKINYYAESISLMHGQKFLKDQEPLENLHLKNGHSFTIILTKREYQVPKNVEPLIVGGLDLTDVKEFEILLKKKDFMSMISGQLSKSEPSSGVAPSTGEDFDDVFNIYREQIAKIRNLGFDDNAKILQALLDTNGNVENAIQLLLQS